MIIHATLHGLTRELLTLVDRCARSSCLVSRLPIGRLVSCLLFALWLSGLPDLMIMTHDAELASLESGCTSSEQQ